MVVEMILQPKGSIDVTFCGANEATRMKVRFIMEVAWQAHFVTNMFIRPTAEELPVYRVTGNSFLPVNDRAVANSRSGQTHRIW